MMEKQSETFTRATPLKQVMTTRLITLDWGAKTSLADSLMRHHTVHHLPVVKEGRLMGLVSQNDLYRNMLSFFFVETETEQEEFLDSFLDIPSIMTPDPLTLTPEDTLAQALTLMMEKRVGCVPIVDAANVLVGIITESDMLRLLNQVL
ncbi:MAG: CBS domain-containing protein [Deltaproteobacteria bacterium]|nr:CBS domain-containing protein [Deltaproteobacteria bacterium]